MEYSLRPSRIRGNFWRGNPLDTVFLTNLTSPPLLFFLLGAAASLARTDLEVPESIAKLLSIYLLMAIGFKGGVALSGNEFTGEALKGLFAALLLASVVPLYVYWLVRRRVSAADAAALAATYGSISAVTFVTCTTYLDTVGIEWNGYLVAAMALMESPAIIVGLLLYRFAVSKGETMPPVSGLLRESLLNGSVFLILGSLIVGYVSGAEGMAQLNVFVKELFIGVLCLFLLDMGIVAMRRLADVRQGRQSFPPLELMAWGLVLPVIGAAFAISLCLILDLPLGDALLITVLAASASYIAVPAALRLALPAASPGLYLTASLGVTFPFNLLIGIPLYHQILVRLSS